MRRRNAQIESIGIVARKLSSIDFPIVFTGGSVVGLLLTDPDLYGFPSQWSSCIHG
jgi:hypothetical protein